MDTIIVSLIVFVSFLLSVGYLLQKRQVRSGNTTRDHGKDNTDHRTDNRDQRTDEDRMEGNREINEIRFRQNNKIFRQVSETISLFTAVFLLCNMPIFCYFLLENTLYWFDLDLSILDRPAIKWYGILVGYVTMTALNCAFNPCLYVARMGNFREWICDHVDKFREWMPS